MAPKRKGSYADEGPRNLELVSRNVSPIWMPYKNCLCDFSDHSLNDKVDPMMEAAKRRKTPGLCCSSCHPTCHGQVTVDIKKPDTASSFHCLLDALHPIPQNKSRSARHSSSREDERKHEQESWQLHASMIQNLPTNPYKNCICDVVGLNDAFQIVQDPSSLVDYVHRPHCLAYPNMEYGKAHPEHASKHAAQLASICQFRKSARSKSGKKYFSRKAVEELEFKCGLHYYGPYRWPRCTCNMYTPLPESASEDSGVVEWESNWPRMKDCEQCGKCCPCCSPSCHAQFKKQRHARNGQENYPQSYNTDTIATDILRAAGIHPTLPPLNFQLRHTSRPKDTSKPNRAKPTKRQRKSMPSSTRYKSTEFVVNEWDSE